ncbi:MAG: hypothetical protein ABR915_25085, partial [Thermoguttaceae bacterium]
MMRAWIATALLAGSWLLGLSYYDLASPWAWFLLVVAGTLLMAKAFHPTAPEFPSGDDIHAKAPGLPSG